MVKSRKLQAERYTIIGWCPNFKHHNNHTGLKRNYTRAGTNGWLVVVVMVRRWAIGRKESDKNCSYFVPNSINTLFCILYKLQTQRMHCDGARSPPVSCGAFASVIAQSGFCATKMFACSSYGCFVFCYYEWGRWALWWLRFLFVFFFGELFTHLPTPPSSAPFSPTW